MPFEGAWPDWEETASVCGQKERVWQVTMVFCYYQGTWSVHRVSIGGHPGEICQWLQCQTWPWRRWLT